MYLSQVAIARLYLWSFLTGAMLGAVYDCLRLSRLLPGGVPPCRLRAGKLPLLGLLPPPKQKSAIKLLLFAEDVCFCLFAGVAVILLFYEAFDGKLRPSAGIVIAVGFGAFHVGLGRLAKRAAAWLGFFLELVVRYLCYFALLPVVLLRRLIAYRRRVRERRARERYTAKKFKELQMQERKRNGKNEEKAV